MNWFAFGGLIIPLIYLCFIGWAHKNLIYTERFDLLATWLCVGTMMACVVAGIPDESARECSAYKEWYKTQKIEQRKKTGKTYEPR